MSLNLSQRYENLRIKPEGSQKEQGGSGRAGDAREDGGQLVPMGRVGAYNSYIKFDNDSNILPCPQPDNEISIEALLYLNTQ